MRIKKSRGRTIFLFCAGLILVLLALSCFLPLMHVFALSFSSKAAATAGKVGLLPVEFTTKAYEYVAAKPEFWRSVLVSIERVVLGVTAQMVMTILIAYPLSKSSEKFKSRSVYTWFFIVTMLFNGGLIPTYMVIDKLNLMDSIWALVLPGIVPVFHVVLLMNFFRELPKEIEEAAFIDGAGYFRSMISIYIPLSKPALATLVLFCAVNHWNAWFDGLIYMNTTSNYPLQSYLQTVIINTDLSLVTTSSGLQSLAEVSDLTNKAAQIFLAILPIICIYPFLQKYFAKGIVLGSVKG